MMMARHATPVFLACWVGMVCASSSWGQINPSVVIAKSGDNVPGLTGIQFSSATPQAFTAPYVNASGTVGFFGGLTGTGVTANVNDSAIFVGSTTSAPQVVVRNGDATPGIAGATFNGMNSVGAISDTGLVVFRATVTGGGTTTANNSGYWGWTSGSGLSLIARGGDTAPGTGGAVWNNFTSTPFVLPDGRIAFSATLVQGGAVTSTNDSGFWIGSPGNLQTLIREGDALTGITGVNFSTPNFTGVNASGQFTFRSAITGTGVTASNNNVIVTGSSSGNFTVMMRTGETPSGIPSGQTVNAFGSSAAVLANGQTYFAASLTGTGVTASNNVTVWVGDSQVNRQMVFRTGDQVPGLPTGVVFAGVGIPKAYGNTVVYSSTVAGTGVTTSNDNYIGKWTSGTGIQVVAREGDVAPGTGGATFGNFVTASLGDGSTPVVGTDGTIAFRAPLLGTGVTAGVNDAAIFLNRNGVNLLLARRGDVISLGEGQGTGTIADLTLTSSIAGMTVGSATLASDGSIAYLATLTDGRSVILFSPVPEPTTIIMIAALGILFVGYYFHRV
ncbi:MAG: choice-of-anchor tandem repeat NxxGxxAF-containing protein [Gemmataceae bacterium]